MVNFGNMMKQAQQLQKKMAEAQDKLSEIEVKGTSGGGLVTVIATAKGAFKRILIDDSLIKTDEKEILEDLIIAAINEQRNTSKLFQINAGTKKPFIVKKNTPSMGSASSGKGKALKAAKYQKNICSNKGMFLKNST